MASYRVRETFFLPDTVFATESSRIPAGIHNQMRQLLRQVQGESVFVPIRSMQYMAVVDPEEVIFVDAQGGYAFHDGEGGRLIRLAWRPSLHRASISAPVDCEIVYYFTDMLEVQRRLLSEIGPALDQALQRQVDRDSHVWKGRVLPFRRESARD